MEAPTVFETREDGSSMETHRVRFKFSEGKIWFSKRTERTVFCVLTVLVLVWGLLVRLGAVAG